MSDVRIFRLTTGLMAVACCGLVIAVSAEWLTPIALDIQVDGIDPVSDVAPLGTVAPPRGDTTPKGQVEPFALSRSLFKSPQRVKTRPTGDKTVEKILSQIELQCVMTQQDQRLAYIMVDGLGLTRCATGDCIEEKFTVLEIADDRVDIEIAGKKVVLRR